MEKIVDNKPNVFIVGAAKAGTTSLYDSLVQYDNVVGGELKEPHYFGDKHPEGKKDILTIEAYRDNFRNSGKVVIDASTSYLYSETAAQEIKEFNPNAKIIIILRDPIKRSLSLYHHQHKALLENSKNFEDALSKEEERILSDLPYGFHYLNTSMYYLQVQRYVELFGSNVHIVKFENITNHDTYYKEMKIILEFISINEDVKMKLRHSNKTYKYKSSFIQKVIMFDFIGRKYLKSIFGVKLAEYIRLKNIGNHEIVSNQLKLKLMESFKPDQDNLKKLIGWSYY